MVIVRSSLQNFRKWGRSPRIWALALLMLVFANNPARALCQAAEESGKALSPWLLPFLLQDRYLQFCTALCLVGLFCDAPFLDPLQPYVLQRIGRKRWMQGQFLYIAAASAVFFLFLWGAMLLRCLHVLDWTRSWGACLTMLAHDNPFFGAPFSADLILGQSAPAATLGSFLMGWLTGCFLGGFMVFLNLNLRRETGALAAGAVCVLDFVLYSYMDELPELFWLSPVSWMNPHQYTDGGGWKLPVRAGILLLLFSLLCLLSIQKLHRQQIETMPQI